MGFSCMKKINKFQKLSVGIEIFKPLSNFHVKSFAVLTI